MATLLPEARYHTHCCLDMGDKSQTKSWNSATHTKKARKPLQLERVPYLLLLQGLVLSCADGCKRPVTCQCAATTRRCNCTTARGIHCPCKAAFKAILGTWRLSENALGRITCYFFRRQAVEAVLQGAPKMRVTTGHDAQPQRPSFDKNNIGALQELLRALKVVVAAPLGAWTRDQENHLRAALQGALNHQGHHSAASVVRDCRDSRALQAALLAFIEANTPRRPRPQTATVGGAGAGRRAAAAVVTPVAAAVVYDVPAGGHGGQPSPTLPVAAPAAAPRAAGLATPQPALAWSRAPALSVLVGALAPCQCEDIFAACPLSTCDSGFTLSPSSPLTEGDFQSLADTFSTGSTDSTTAATESTTAMSLELEPTGRAVPSAAPMEAAPMPAPAFPAEPMPHATMVAPEQTLELDTYVIDASELSLGELEGLDELNFEGLQFNTPAQMERALADILGLP